MSSVEQHRELVVDGDVAQALDLCRRLLRTDSGLQRVETAHLVLERLRSSNDSSDDANALLRLLGNYVAPTRELTEEILSLLLFCDHRVLLIHHLPKLTYQSKECVHLVVEAYLELLATDRSLLVPVLGSLAEMPLDVSEKNTVVEATQSLLDAAVEEDIPAVVQSLLSMVTKSSAPKALARLRTECNRISSATLSLTMEVIGRYATAGSVALTALLRLIRHVDPLTTFDIVLLTFVMGKSAENEVAVRATTSVAQSGRLHGRMMREAAAMLVKPEWGYLLPSFVRFCSCLLAVCFRAATQPALALNLIANSVDSLIVLVETRSTVQEEALTLLLTIASQPKRLLLLANADSVQRTRSALCWNVAEVIALRFLELARRNAATLASSSHLFLDHLHGIASATLESEIDGRYPSHILDLLCSTMALLTKKERGIYSLLMITIQKQLVSRVGTSGLGQDQQSFRFQYGRSLQTRASAVEVKQLMAVFLTGHLLKNQVVVDSRDRKSLANWMLRLLTSANRDETLLHVMRFVRDEMGRTREASSLEQERALLTAAISQIFRKKGLSWTPRDQVLQRTQEDTNVAIAFDELSWTISNEEYDQSGSVLDEDFEADATEVAAANTVTRNLMAHSLACIYDSFLVILEECRIASAAGDSNWTNKMMELLATGASPDDDVSRCDNPHGCNEIFFRFLSRQCLEMTDPTLACLVTDTLVALVLSTRKSPLVSQLCLALLHQTFPSLPSPSQFVSDPGKFFNGLPLRSLSNAVVSPSKGSVVSLARYRCSSLKWRHIAYLVVGSWTYSASASAGSFLLAQYLEEMRLLIDAAVPNESKRSRRKRATSFDESEEETDEGDLEENRRQDELAVVVDGKHIVLKSLTNESLPYFIEAVLLCAIASLYRAAPKKPNAQGRADFNPFSDYCRAIHIFESALRVFAQGEACGFNLPVKTNLLLLRAGAFAARSVKCIITKCVAWRVEQSVSDATGALGHLCVLFGAALAMAATMETVTTAFQERVVLKMQRNGRKGGWANELLAKTYGKKYNTRRQISKTEAKLLPFFSHGIQELQDVLQAQSDVNNIALETAKVEWEAAESIWGDYEPRDVMLSDDKLVSACRTLQAEDLTVALLRDWRPALSIDDDGDDTDLENEDEQGGSQELDEESLSDDEDNHDNGFIVKSYGTTSSRMNSSATSVLTGRKKPAVELQDNEALGFPTIVVNFKKHKKNYNS
ncbi:uncharacterized protein KRP23_849 [Phytophthora ramorum]|uniref:uncharacterized protein n=1 Tax=Phytophthora ramorum TaxID=164328 RepID=UPI0030AB062D|nr:hypothetical protein KRP23_849 [Phytophthora ramorum]